MQNMRANLRNLALWTGIVLATGLSVLAGPLQRADVPANATWVAHVDCDALRPTTIGQYVLGEMDKPENQAKLAVFQTLFSVDLRTQLHGLTLYSTGTTPKDGILLVYADFDANRLVTLAKAAKDYQSTPYKQHIIHNWIDEEKAKHTKAKDAPPPRIYAAIHGNRVIFGQQEARVARALDVLDAAVPNLAGGSDFPQLGVAGSTSFLEAAAHKLDLPDTDPNAAIFRLSKLMTLQVGETQRQFAANLTLEASDEEVAGHIASIAQGLVALMKLQKEKPDSVRLGEALALKQDGARVLASLVLPAGEVVEMIKADAARKAPKKEEKQ